MYTHFYTIYVYLYMYIYKYKETSVLYIFESR